MNQSPLWKRLVAGLLRSITFAGAAFIVLEIAIWIHPPLMAWALNVAHPASSLCPSGAVLAGTQKHKRVVEGGQEIFKHSHLIETDAAAGLVHWATPHGDWWMPKGSEEGALLFLVQQENKIYGEGEQGVHKGDIVIDWGAHVGTYTREALNEGAALVVAIEPAPNNVASLRRNFKKEIEEKRVIIEPVGVWDKDDVLPLYEDPTNSGGDSFVIRGPNDRVVNVPLVAIDKLVKELGLLRVDFIKMDIKGATTKALFGAKGALASWKPRLALSTEEKEDDPAEIRSFVLGLQPAYQVVCGICSVGDYKVNPDVLLFQ